MGKVNTNPQSGTRDFLPLDVLRRKHVINIVEEVYQSFGFEPLETPTMERLDTLLGKYGEEGDQLIFRVMKRGEKLQRQLERSPSEDNLADSGLRYDLTVPLARVAAEYQSQLPRVFKRFQIQPVYRADRPAKGRFREFYQCDLDVVGSNSLTVEAEVLGAAARVFQRLGFTGPDDFKIRINHRQILRGIMQVAGVPEAMEEGVLIAVDKLDKIGLDAVRRELSERGVRDEAQEGLIKILEGAPQTNQETLDWLEQQFQDSEIGRLGTSELRTILSFSSKGPAADHLQVDPYLARGLSYYTGPIFEATFSGFSGSAGGGGRYDNLIGMFCGRQIPACGFSLGLERILLILEEKSLFPERLAGQPQFLVAMTSDDLIPETLELANELRSAGLRVDVFPESTKYGKQFKYADQRQIRYALLMGPQEVEAGAVIVKDLQTGDQEECPRERLTSHLQALLGQRENENLQG